MRTPRAWNLVLADIWRRHDHEPEQSQATTACTKGCDEGLYLLWVVVKAIPGFC